MESLLVSLGIIVAFGVAAQWIAWKFQLPSILLLLIFGFISGPVFGIVNPDQIFGDLLFPLVSLSVAIILFEGGLTLKFSEIHKAKSTVINLISIGMLITWFITFWAARVFLHLDFLLAMLLGAILTVSGPTVVLPLLRYIKPKSPLGSILKWEGILIDPIGAVMAVLVLEVILIKQFDSALSVILKGVLATTLVGGLLGVLGGLILVRLIRKDLIPDFLQIPISVMILVCVYIISNHFYQESGLLAVTVMGMILANTKDISINAILEFKENLRVLLISFLFILLAARINFSDFQSIGTKEAIFLAVIIFVARPAAVIVSTFKSGLSWRERAFLCWVAPRGIVAAAVSSLFALSLETAGFVEAHYIVTYTFVVIVGTVTFYGLTSPLAAILLGVRQEKPQGVLIVGANSFARSLAKEIKAEGFKAVLVDTNRAKINVAHLEGLEAYHGNILSEYILGRVDFDSIGRVLALTPNDEANSLACVHFTDLFGKDEVYQLAPAKDMNQTKNKSVTPKLRGKILFSKDLFFAKINEKFVRGATIKTTELTEEFNYQQYISHHGNTHIPLFTISEEGNLSVVVADEGFSVDPGVKLISLIINEKAN
ncbi:MAG: sodium:proton antiporter [Bdellovibrionales bacterium]|nr:sodium:proton antiporter [Bdellovibrionales bacterium]